MANSVSVASRQIIQVGKNSSKMIEKIVINWSTAGDGGSVSASAIKGLKGYLIKVVTIPSSSPTDNYDIRLFDPDASALDALGGLLDNRDTANAEQVYTTVSGSAAPVLLAGDYNFQVINNSEDASGQVIFYIDSES